MDREYLERRFAEGLVRRLATLTELLADRDLEGARQALHSLAGIGGTYGHPRVTEVARRGEHSCERGDLEGFAGAIRDLERYRQTAVAGSAITHPSAAMRDLPAH